MNIVNFLARLFPQYHSSKSFLTLLLHSNSFRRGWQDVPSGEPGSHWIGGKILIALLCSYFWQDDKMRQVPASRADIFQNADLSPVSKRSLMRFLKNTLDAVEGRGSLKACLFAALSNTERIIEGNTNFPACVKSHVKKIMML